MSRITPSALGQNGGQETDPSMPKFDSSASQETIIRKQVSTEVREKSKETIAMPKKSLWKVSLHVLVFTLVGIPIVLILIALIFGAMLSGFEDWTVKEGFFYICGNLLGLGNPITNVSPETTRGEMLDILICTWSNMRHAACSMQFATCDRHPAASHHRRRQHSTRKHATCMTRG